MYYSPVARPGSPPLERFSERTPQCHEDIDYSDIPPITPEMFAEGVVEKGGVFVRRVKQSLTLRVNAVLEAYMKAHKEAGK